MAGNIVKWWRHKILGGYKHFSGFHECPTDTEELIYPIRAPSSCSAPPDLLLTSDREQIHIRCPTPQSHQHHHHHHHQQNSKNEKNHHYHSNQVQTTSPHVNQETEKDLTQIANKKLDKKNLSKTPVMINTTINGSSNVNNNNSGSSPDRVHLEEFTCDVSVEGGGKTPQPLQFSFTLYDLDGHGKITKDDIAGIVSTIYESIGKTVVVPHYGSKTINVRLTVSPDGKKVKERERTTSCTKKGVITPRRRVRQRKLISDDDGSDTSNDCVERRRNTSQSIAARNNIGGSGGRNSGNVCAAATKENINRISKDCSTTTGTTTTTTESTNSNKQPQLAATAAAAAAASTTAAVTQVQQVILNEHQSQNIYDSIQNLKFYSNHKSASMVQPQQQSNDTNSTNVINLHIKENNEISCQDCKFDNVVVAHKYNLRKKLLRKSRSRHKQHKITNINNNNNIINPDLIDKPEPRVRSLSVGNENCYNQIDDDGNDENFWKSSLRRHELFEIIRESMEKNRLCFQANRKPVPDTSPSNFHRHRHRSHTITKMIDENSVAQNDQTVVIHHPLPETNLCGYDSFLHATICANGNNNVAGNTASTPVRNTGPHHQNGSNSNNHIINNNLSSSANNKKALKLKNHHHHHHHSTTTNNTTAGNVYTRLNVAGSNDAAGHKLNTTILSQLNPNLTSEQKFNRTINHVEKWLTDRDHQIPVPNTDTVNNAINNNINSKQYKSKLLVRSKSKEEINLLKIDLDNIPKKVENLICFDKLKITEDTASCIGSCGGIGNGKKLTTGKLQQQQQQQQQQQHHHVHNSPVKSIGGNSAGGGESVNKLKTGLIMEYASIPVNAEPSECENLLRCSDEDTNNPASSSVTPSTVHRYVHEHIHHHYHHFENDET